MVAPLPPTGPGWPTVDSYKLWARLYDDMDDAAIAEALDAVALAVVARCPTLQAAPCPYDVAYATLLWTNRLLSRRNSPDGVVGVADLGIANVSRFDTDIIRMLSAWWAPVLA
jgi:hypothetical protein